MVASSSTLVSARGSTRQSRCGLLLVRTAGQSESVWRSPGSRGLARWLRVVEGFEVENRLEQHAIEVCNCHARVVSDHASLEQHAPQLLQGECAALPEGQVLWELAAGRLCGLYRSDSWLRTRLLIQRRCLSPSLE